MTLILNPTDQRFCTAVAKDPNAPKRGDPGFFDSIPDRGSRYPSGPGGAGANPREELPLPSKPPYTAFVGNLTFECTEQELGDMFADMETNSVKIIRGHDEKPKGFGYVEFKTLDGLKDALTRTGMQVMGRSIRVSVAEPPKSSSGGFGGFGGPSMADSADQWRRAGPLPPRSPRDQTRGHFRAQGLATQMHPVDLLLRIVIGLLLGEASLRLALNLQLVKEADFVVTLSLLKDAVNAVTVVANDDLAPSRLSMPSPKRPTTGGRIALLVRKHLLPLPGKLRLDLLELLAEDPGHMDSSNVSLSS